ncbi:MAG: glycosyltransferase [Solobacterium sp.]|nr:glycosyltransferase [Solobacterium sp.]
MISIIVPVYKVEKYLHQCIDSILNQTFTDLEILLVDDGSPDRCGEICDRYQAQDSRIRVFHTDNHGLSAARNLGIKNAHGAYIGFVDSDDWIEPQMYEILLNSLEEFQADVSACNYIQEYENRSVKTMYPAAVYTGRDCAACLIDGKISSVAWNKLFRAKLLDENTFPEGRNYEDVFSMHKILFNADRTVAVSAAQYHYRKREDSIIKTNSARNLIDFADAHLARYAFFTDEHPEYSDKVMNQTVLRGCATGLSKVWRWWYGCSRAERIQYRVKIESLKTFSQEHFPLFGERAWPAVIRLSSLFMHSNTTMSFFLLYSLNQLFRILFPDKSNIA